MKYFMVIQKKREALVQLHTHEGFTVGIVVVKSCLRSCNILPTYTCNQYKVHTILMDAFRYWKTNLLVLCIGLRVAYSSDLVDEDLVNTALLLQHLATSLIMLNDMLNKVS